MKFQQRLELKREMHFSSHDCYMFSSVQVYVTSETKQYLTSIDRLCLHVMHSFAFIYPFSPRVSLSLFSLSSLQLWMFVQVEWNHQDEKISLRSSFYSRWICCPPFYFLWLFLFFLICISFTVIAWTLKTKSLRLQRKLTEIFQILHY